MHFAWLLMVLSTAYQTIGAVSAARYAELLISGCFAISSISAPPMTILNSVVVVEFCGSKSQILVMLYSSFGFQDSVRFFEFETFVSHKVKYIVKIKYMIKIY